MLAQAYPRLCILYFGDEMAARADADDAYPAKARCRPWRHHPITLMMSPCRLTTQPIVRFAEICDWVKGRAAIEARLGLRAGAIAWEADRENQDV